MPGVLIVIALAACSGSGPVTGPAVVRAHGTPVVSSSLSPPGTVLGDGFRVPPGASLIGAALPDSVYTGYPGLTATRRWTALLLVTGNAASVTRDLLRQAAEQGLQVRSAIPGKAPAVCRSTRQAQTNTHRPRGLLCSTGAVSVATVRSSLYRRMLGIAARQGSCPSCTHPVAASLAVVSYSTFDADPVTLPRSATDLPRSLPISPTTGALELPRPGDILHLAKGVDLRVVRGGVPLSPPANRALVLMRVDDGERVLERYRRQALEKKPMGIRNTTEFRDGWRVHHFAVDDGSDAFVEYELFQRARSADYIRVSVH